jgi:hypothetical protein
MDEFDDCGYEPYENNPYDGNDQDDMDFYADTMTDEEFNDVVMDELADYAEETEEYYTADLEAQYEDRVCCDFDE